MWFFAGRYRLETALEHFAIQLQLSVRQKLLAEHEIQHHSLCSNPKTAIWLSIFSPHHLGMEVFEVMFRPISLFLMVRATAFPLKRVLGPGGMIFPSGKVKLMAPDGRWNGAGFAPDVKDIPLCTLNSSKSHTAYPSIQHGKHFSCY